MSSSDCYYLVVAIIIFIIIFTIVFIIFTIIFIYQWATKRGTQQNVVGSSVQFTVNFTLNLKQHKIFQGSRIQPQPSRVQILQPPESKMQTCFRSASDAVQTRIGATIDHFWTQKLGNE